MINLCDHDIFSDLIEDVTKDNFKQFQVGTAHNQKLLMKLKESYCI